MISWFYKLLLAFVSTAFLLVVYAIKSAVVLPLNFPPHLVISEHVSYIVYIFLLLSITVISLIPARWLDPAEIQKGQIKSVEYANDSFLPSYLGYFFVALDVPNCQTLLYVYPLVLLFTFLSKTIYFNPIFLLFGYKFYHLTTVNEVRYFVISRKKLKDPAEVQFSNLRAINDYTFIET